MHDYQSTELNKNLERIANALERLADKFAPKPLRQNPHTVTLAQQYVGYQENNSTGFDPDMYK